MRGIAVVPHDLMRAMKQSSEPPASLVERALTELGATNPVFESEIEFQLEFAVWLRLHYPELGVKLEQRAYPNSRDNLDLALKDVRIAVELKFAVTPTSPADVIRYGFIKDICRLETLCDEPDWDRGYAILLTNRADLWEQRNNPSVTDAQFHLYEGREIQGTLSWTKDTAEYTQNAYPALYIRKHYRMQWKKFGNLGFRYLMAAVH